MKSMTGASMLSFSMSNAGTAVGPTSALSLLIVEKRKKKTFFKMSSYKRNSHDVAGEESYGLYRIVRRKLGCDVSCELITSDSLVRFFPNFIRHGAPRPSAFLAQRQPANKRTYAGLLPTTTTNVSPRPSLPRRRR